MKYKEWGKCINGNGVRKYGDYPVYERDQFVHRLGKILGKDMHELTYTDDLTLEALKALVYSHSFD